MSSEGRGTYRARWVAATLAWALLSTAGQARAQDPEEAAEALFQDARRLVEAKRFNEACPKLLASYKLAPAVGTLLNLADCYEQAGQLASARERFQEAIALAQRLGRPDREKTARERAERLESRVARLIIRSHEPAAEVKLDGHLLDSREVPIDPGVHTIDAVAKGKKPFTTTIEVGDRARTLTVEIPTLVPVQDQADSIAPVALAQRRVGTTQRVLGIVGMGLGGAGVVVGTFFGLRASSKWSDSKAHCDGLDCDATGVDLATSAKDAGTVSTVSFLAGGVLFASGAVLFLTAPASRKSVGVAFGGSSLLVRGSF